MRKETPEQIAKFAAEMAELSKRPEMRHLLTATEARRQEREALREAEAEQKRKEAALIEIKRRDVVTTAWFNHHMMLLAPRTWATFKRTKDVKPLEKAGWELIAHATEAEKPSCLPVPVTVCTINYKGKAKRIERLVWEMPKEIPSKLVKL